MRVVIPIDEAAAEPFHPKSKLDGSGVGVNYVDAYLKPFKVTLEDGRKLLVKRRGIKLTLTIGDVKGEGLLRRLVYGPEPKVLVREALIEAAGKAGASIAFEPASVVIELP